MSSASAWRASGRERRQHLVATGHQAASRGSDPRKRIRFRKPDESHQSRRAVAVLGDDDLRLARVGAPRHRRRAGGGRGLRRRPVRAARTLSGQRGEAPCLLGASKFREKLGHRDERTQSSRAKRFSSRLISATWVWRFSVRGVNSWR